MMCKKTNFNVLDKLFYLFGIWWYK